MKVRVRLKSISTFDQLLIVEIDNMLRKIGIFMIKYNQKEALLTSSNSLKKVI